MNNKQLKLLKVLAFPVTAAFSFGIFAADIQAETSQTDEMRQDADANTASEMNGETFVEEQPTKAEEPTLKVQEDAPLKEWVAPSDCDSESGIEGVYLGEWSQIGENQVMILQQLNIKAEVGIDSFNVYDFNLYKKLKPLLHPRKMFVRFVYKMLVKNKRQV